MTVPTYFRTDKIDLAAFLMTSGCPLSQVDRESRGDRIVKWFVFAESENAAASPAALALTFNEGDPTVSVQTYLYNQRRCRDIAHGKK